MNLNPQQQEAVDTIYGPVLISAAPGSGKTRVVTERIKYILECGYSPHDILAVTFTNSAAKEMAERLSNDLDEDVVRDMTICTFHRLAMKVIRKYGYLVGRKPDFSIYDEKDQADIVAAVMKDLGIKKPTPEHVLKKKHNKEYRKIMTEYMDRLRKVNAFDFDMLVDSAMYILENKEEARVELQHKYRFISVDEYQDVNITQYRMANILSQEWGNICAVGDTDQCLVKGTIVRTPSGPRPIESISVGGEVCTFLGAASGEGRSIVSNAAKRSIKENVVCIRTESGAAIKCTKTHHIPAHWPDTSRYGKKPGWHYVYLMRDKNLGYRIGYTSDPVVRRRLEKNILGLLPIMAFDNMYEALAQETILSLKYGIPTVLFRERGSKTEMPQEYLEKIFNSIDTVPRARRMLEDMGKSWESPIMGQSRESRKIVNIYALDGTYGSKTAPFYVSYEHNGERIRAQISTLRKAREEAAAIAEDKGATIKELWHVGGRLRIPMHPAGNILPGMMVVTNGALDKVLSVEEVMYKGDVYDIEVDLTHNFILGGGTMVGNSIFSFAGSDVRLMGRFRTDHEDAKLVTIDTTYRCPANVMKSAAMLVKHNPGRIDTDPKSINPDGILKRLVFDNCFEEASWIARKCEQLQADGHAPHDMAVLCRTHQVAKNITQVMRNGGLEVNVCGRTRSLMACTAAQDFNAYMRIIANPYDSASLRRVANAPAKEISWRNIAGIEALSRAAEINLLEAGKEYLYKKREPHDWINFILNAKSLTFAEAVDIIGNTLRTFYEQNSLLTRARDIQLIREVATDMLRRDGHTTVEDYLEDISELSSQDDASREGGVNVMTAHTSKGLEWPFVFIPAMEIGTFPSGSCKTTEAIEEERRLFYVALTRAKKGAFVLGARVREAWGKERETTESMFVAEAGLEK